ncbi:hypothetical protein GPA19_08885 [Azoarcus indigens]|uniref:hypothetical protein n=1 Tax=Azoarcus indigens TaxID=29545 RepID=UPI0010621952|nr:hypothetical protein [Azoarcus indigens]NMG65061.1 hypothetical protein [Azoarcus indigens]
MSPAPALDQVPATADDPVQVEVVAAEHRLRRIEHGRIARIRSRLFISKEKTQSTSIQLSEYRGGAIWRIPNHTIRQLTV